MSKISSASVKVMRSYDYCHFEVVISSDEIKSTEDINNLRIEAAKLSDTAVKEYKNMRKWESSKTGYNYDDLDEKVKAIKKDIPESERTPEHKAQIKLLEDLAYEEYQYGGGFFDEEYY